MGRATSLGRRPYSAKDDDIKHSIDRRTSLTAERDESVLQFRRFKPRVGTQYQSKVPKWKDRDEAISSRPKPEQMSNEIPHLTHNEARLVQEGRELESHGLSSDLSLPSSVDQTRFPGYGSRVTPRGGLCVHRPHTEMDSFLSFAQPLTLSLDAMPDSFGQATSACWKQRLLGLYNDENGSTRCEINNNSPPSPSPPKRGRPSKQRGVKRKLKHEESQDGEKKAAWELMTNSTTTSSLEDDNSLPQLLVAEGDECALEYLNLRHNGDIELAKLSAMVNMASGRASKARKCSERQWQKDHARQLPSDLPLLWRTRYERSENTSSLWGDLRGDKNVAYPFQQRKPNCGQATLGLSRTKNGQASSSDEDLKREWSSVLVFGQKLEQELRASCTEKAGKKPLLSCVLSFMNHACSLPPPENVFGSRHVLLDEIPQCMSAIIDHVCNARNMRAKLFDILYDGKKEGVDVSSFSKLLDEADRTIPIQLDEVETWRRSLRIVADWQSQLDSILEKDGEDYDCCDLQAAETLVEQGSCHGIPSRSLVQLEAKVETAYQLRDRIRDWQKTAAEGTKESIKFVAALVRDANRLKLSFPEVAHLLSVHREAESWIDRANIAIRSRISISEIRSLIQRACEMPVDLSEYTDKLLSRVRVAEDWFEGFKKLVRGDAPAGDESDMLLWMSCMRLALNNGKQAALHEMASEGSRIPVEIDCVKMLQLELDAKSWSLKAKKWIPDCVSVDGSSSKKGRLEDIREHVEKADLLRDKLILPNGDTDKWTLDGEAELKMVVRAADEWFEKYKPLIEGDNRRSNGRVCVSLAKLRQIVDDGNAIFANIGSALGKMSKMLSQAESWYEKHKSLLDRCNQRTASVTILELDVAVRDAVSEVAVDLEEAIGLKSLKDRVEAWLDRSLAAAPKRSKRAVKGRSAKNRFSVAELEQLIREAAEFPVDTSDDTARLEEQLLSVHNWKKQALLELANIAGAFRTLRETVNAVHGFPSDFTRKRQSREDESSSTLGNSSRSKCDVMEIEGETGEEKKGADDSSQTDTASATDSEHETAHLARMGLGRCNVHKLIAALLKTSKLVGVGTPEEESTSSLESISRWCIKSLKYLDSSKEIFDKRFFGAFDRFLLEGHDFLKHTENDYASIQLDDAKLKNDLVKSCCGLVSDQLARLEVLRRDRERFVAWCSQAKDILQCENKVPVEVLAGLFEKCLDFPPVSDMVQKIRNLKVKATRWANSARLRLEGKEKMSLPEAKSLLDEAEKLNISCDESKMLRNAIRAAKGWANRVKRSKLDEGATHIDDVKGLLDAHESLHIAMPDDVAKLRQAMKCYCICRRPYAGFMIGCDSCDEWYHGPCIGLSEARADRFNKYICVRCYIGRIYKASAASIVSLIRKWTNVKERKKARQVESQKHQRKVRKETKDLEKLQAEISELEQWLKSNETTIDVDSKSNVETDRANFPFPGISVVSSLKMSSKQHGTKHRGNLSIICGTPDDIENSKQDPPTKAKSNNRGSPTVKAGEEIDASEAPLCSEDAKFKIDKAAAARKTCEDRLFALTEQAAIRLATEHKEDQNSESLKRWFVRVRSLVLAPSTEARSCLSRPSGDGSLSPPMLNLLADSKRLGIHGLLDVTATINAFRCLSWSFRAANVFCRRPNLAELRSLTSQSTSLVLPDEKAVRMMKSLIQRAASWQCKVMQALTPKPGETKPICVDVLKNLLEEAGNIPLKLPEELMLETAIDDKGARHCVCGGPSDGSVMLSCDKCDRWFHGRCMGVTNEESDALSSWICLPCAGEPIPKVSYLQGPKSTIESDSDEDDFSPVVAHEKLSWPPYGLIESQEARDALGDCCAIPDDVDDMFPDVEASQATSSKVFEAPTVRSDLRALPSYAVSSAVITTTKVVHEPLSIVDDRMGERDAAKTDSSSLQSDDLNAIINGGTSKVCGKSLMPSSIHEQFSVEGCHGVTGFEAVTPLVIPSDLASTADVMRIPNSTYCEAMEVSVYGSQSETGSPDGDYSCKPTHTYQQTDAHRNIRGEILSGYSGMDCEGNDTEAPPIHFSQSCIGRHVDREKVPSKLLFVPPSGSIGPNLNAEAMSLHPIADMMVECDTRCLDAIGTSV